MLPEQPTLAGARGSSQYYASLDDLEQGIWATLASHARPLDVNSDEIEQEVDVTDDRLQTLYEAFDRDFDGKLSKSELLQGLAQQGFPNLEGARAFDILWNTCEKAGGSDGGESRVSFSTFKRVVQRLKLELLFLTEQHHNHAAQADGGEGFLTPQGGASPPRDVQVASYVPDGRRGGNRHVGLSLLSNADGADYGAVSPVEAVAVEAQWRAPPVRFSSIDYNTKKAHLQIPVLDTYSFLVTHRDSSEFVMRWLHLEGLDRLTILKFAVKYSLHPLCVEDALKLDEQQPKVNQYGSHLFVVVPFFRLSHESLLALELRRKRRLQLQALKKKRDGGVRRSIMQRAQRCGSRRRLSSGGDDLALDDDFRFRIEASKLCLFVAGPPSYDTLISMHSQWESFNMDVEEERSWMGSPGREGSNDMGGYMPGRHVFAPVVNALKVDYSVLRQGCSRQLLYKLLDEVVDNFLPITKAYRTRVRMLHDQLHRDDTKWDNQDLVENAIQMKGELQRLHRRIRPMTAVIRHLADDPQVGGVDVRVYMEDVQESILRCLEEIQGCIEMCDSVKEESRSLREQRTNEVLYTLTLVTTIFVPLQFVTGIYGMNFTSTAGRPSMPELLWPHGYVFFWCLCATLFFSLVCYFKYVKKWL